MLNAFDVRRVLEAAGIAEHLAEAGAAAVLELEKHNGWTNIETWTVNLWLTSSANAEASCREIAGECDSDMEAGEAIRDRWCEPLCESAGPSDGLLHDMLNRAFGRVDWRKIGAAFREA